jgi:hypothetical protein
MGGRSPADRERAMLWVLNQSDGGASLLDIAQRSGIGFPVLKAVAEELEQASLLRAADVGARARPPSTRKKRPGIRSTGRRK